MDTFSKLEIYPIKTSGIKTGTWVTQEMMRNFKKGGKMTEKLGFDQILFF